MITIDVHRFGKIEKEFADYVLKTVGDCYNCIDNSILDIVDLYLFERSSALDAYISREKRSLGIKTSALESSFFAVHDAWHGIPRIMLAYDKMLALPKMVKNGVLNHEAAHTILHGSIESYSFPLPRLLLERKEIQKQIATDILYLVSVAVKDYEVTCLLYGNRFVEDQVAYCKLILEPSEDDRESWNLAKDNKYARVLVLVSILKTTCCAMPLLKDEKYCEELNESIKEAMSYIPSEWSKRLMYLLRSTSEFKQGTHENVDLFMKRIFEELVL